MSRRIESAPTDLPQPDSPTTATVSPSPTSYEMPSTAFTTPADVSKCVRSSSTSSSFVTLFPARNARFHPFSSLLPGTSPRLSQFYPLLPCQLKAPICADLPPMAYFSTVHLRRSSAFQRAPSSFRAA